MGLGRAGGPAAAVAAGAPAQQHDHIPGHGLLAHHIGLGEAPTTAPISRRLAT